MTIPSALPATMTVPVAGNSKQVSAANRVAQELATNPQGMMAQFQLSGVPQTRRVRDDLPPIPGDMILDAVREVIAMFVRADDTALDAAALWVAHTWFRNPDKSLLWWATPRLFVTSREPGSGKSRFGATLRYLVPEPTGLLAEPSGPSIARLAEVRKALFIDEADILVGEGGRKSMVRSIINDGYNREGTTSVASGHSAQEYSVFSPMCMMGLDSMTEGSVGDRIKATLTRCIMIRMRKAGGTNRPASLGERAMPLFTITRRLLELWSAQEMANGIPEDPPLPAALTDVGDRPQEIWEPLFRIANAAGGPWPGYCEDACLDLGFGMTPGRVVRGEAAEALQTLGELAGSLR